MKSATVVLSAVLALAAGSAGAAESKMAKKYDAGPAIQGNSDPALHSHKKKAMKPKMHKAM